MSKEGNSEVYVHCTGYLGLETLGAQTSKFLQYVGKSCKCNIQCHTSFGKLILMYKCQLFFFILDENIMIARDDIPSWFIDRIINSADLFAQNQV